MVLEAFCRHFGLRREWNPWPHLAPPEHPRIQLPAGLAADEAMGRAIRAACDIEADDHRMRQILKKPPEERAAYFTALRENYPVRREFPHTTVELAAPQPALEAALKVLGFSVAKTG